jgi:uncharacterized protein YdaU (DUF1376 family)
MNFYRRFPADYANDTRHLSYIEHGAYTLLLDYCYTTERILPKSKDEIHRRMCARTDEEKSAIDTVLKEFFKLTRWGYEHKRVKAEIARSKGISAIASANGRKGIHIRLAKAKRNFSEGPASQILDTRVQIPQPDTPKTFVLPDDFVRFWEEYPRKEAKKKTLSAWKSLAIPDRLAAYAGIARWKTSGRWDDLQFVPLPTTYLNGRRWEDELKPKGENFNERFDRIAAKYAQ